MFPTKEVNITGDEKEKDLGGGKIGKRRYPIKVMKSALKQLESWEL